MAVEWATTTEDGTTGFDLYRWNAAQRRLGPGQRRARHGGARQRPGRALPGDRSGGPDRRRVDLCPDGGRRQGHRADRGSFTVVPESAGKEGVGLRRRPHGRARGVPPSARELGRLSRGRGPRRGCRGRRPRREFGRLAGLGRTAAHPHPGSRPLSADRDRSRRRFGVSARPRAQWISTGQLRLENRGQVVRTFTPAGQTGAIFFYAKAADSIYTRDNVYWLTVASGDAMATTAVAGVASGEASFLDRQACRDRRLRGHRRRQRSRIRLLVLGLSRGRQRHRRRARFRPAAGRCR